LNCGISIEVLCKKIPAFGNTQTVIAQCKKPTRKWHIWFLPTHEPKLEKPKEPFFSNARQKTAEK
jgi:hypothetical protein